MLVDRPIFIVGPPRSGTSLLYSCLGTHPDVGYFNRANRKYLNYPRLAYFLTRLKLYGDRPRESHSIWERFYRGKDDVMTAEHADPRMKAWYDEFITRVLKVRGTTRLAAKIPSFSMRIPWLEALFPDALFVVAHRDWRATIGSTVIKRAQAAWFGVMPPGWRDHVDDPPALGAAWMFRKSHERIQAEEEKRPNRFLRVWYEDLCKDPVPVMERTAAFCGLSWTPEAVAALPNYIRPASDKWKRTGVPSPEMIQEIRKIHGSYLANHEYPCGF